MGSAGLLSPPYRGKSCLTLAAARGLHTGNRDVLLPTSNKDFDCGFRCTVFAIRNVLGVVPKLLMGGIGGWRWRTRHDIHICVLISSMGIGGWRWRARHICVLISQRIETCVHMPFRSSVD